MDIDEDEIAKKALQELKGHLNVLEEHLAPLLARPLSEIYGKLPINEKAQLQVLLSYAINTLYFAYLKTQDHDPASHNVTNELKRIEDYVDKIKEAEGRMPKANMQVDKEAAYRFIKAALAGGDEAQEEGLTSKKRKAMLDADDDEDQAEGSEEGELQEDEDDDDEEDEEVDLGKAAPPSKSQKRQRMDPFKGYNKKKNQR